MNLSGAESATMLIRKALEEHPFGIVWDRFLPRLFPYCSRVLPPDKPDLKKSVCASIGLSMPCATPFDLDMVVQFVGGCQRVGAVYECRDAVTTIGRGLR
jgi:hypothetical protein